MALNTQSVRFKDATILTVASGEVSASDGYHIIASESGTSDDLDTITADFSDLTVNSTTYRPMLLIKADTGDTITVKHNTGNIQLSSSADYALSGDLVLQLFYDGTNWVNVDIAGAGGGGGEANTSSNAGLAGVGVVLPKSGVDLPFKAIDAGSNKITVTDDVPNNTVDIDVDDANINPSNVISGKSLTSVTVESTDKVLIQDTSDSDNLKTVTAQSIADLASGGGASVDSMYFSYEEPSGTAGGVIATGAFRTQPFNTTIKASGLGSDFVSLSSNQFTLDTGRYVVMFWSSIFNFSGTEIPAIRLSKISGGTVTGAEGDSGTYMIFNIPANTTNQIMLQFPIDVTVSSAVIEMQVAVTSASTNWGQAIASSNPTYTGNERFATIQFIKL